MSKSTVKYRCVKPALAIAMASIFVQQNASADTAFTGMRDINSTEIVSDMGVGWNLGNTLDTKGPDETYWGNPVADKATINEVAARGFKTLRLPVTWQMHMGEAPDYIIEKEWLERVETVANYAFDNDMYVIIDIHHDDEWLIPTYEKKDEAVDQIGKVWTQVAEYFKEYGDYLIFDTINEPRDVGSENEWVGGTAEGRECVNAYHQASVDAIRATGGNNATRHLMISTYAAGITDVAFNDFVMPDTINTIASIHNYSPWRFCLTDTRSDWGGEADEEALTGDFDWIAERFTAKGIPVVLGEWASTNNNNLEDRIRHAKFYTELSKRYGFCPVWWDNGDIKGSAILNRYTLEWNFPNLLNGLLPGVEPVALPSFDIAVDGGMPNGSYRAGKLVTITADTPPPGYAFSKWSGDVDTLKDTTAASSVLEVPEHSLEIKASYIADSSSLFSPGVIKEAEDYVNMLGVKTEECSEGTLNLGWIDDEDWIDYHILIPASGTYELDLRIASEPGGGLITAEVDGEAVVMADIPSTGDWQNWETATTDLFYLNEGSHTLRIKADKGGFNLNWIKLREIDTSIHVTGVELTEETLTLDADTTVSLQAVITPDNADNKAVTWSSSNTAVATVDDNGEVTAIAPGNTEITVTTVDGVYTATCVVTVPETAVPFYHSGAGEFTWFTTVKPSYVNSWCLENLTINGEDYTNKWSNSMPEPQNGGWTIIYSGKYPWSHFEAIK